MCSLLYRRGCYGATWCVHLWGAVCCIIIFSNYIGKATIIYYTIADILCHGIDILYHGIIYYTMALYPIPWHYILYMYHGIIYYTMALYPIPYHYILYHGIISYTMSLYPIPWHYTYHGIISHIPYPSLPKMLTQHAQ